MSNTKANFKAIPIIDVGSLVKPGAPDSERRKTAQLIGEACRYVGFFYIKNHGVPEDFRILPILWGGALDFGPVSYTHRRANETRANVGWRLVG